MTDSQLRRVRVIDSHTGGEPTRIVVSGGPDLGNGPLSARLERFRREHDSFRSAVVNEPRGSDVMVGALLCEPVDPACAAGVIFFNNVGYLGMCGHGTIGLVSTLLLRSIARSNCAAKSLLPSTVATTASLGCSNCNAAIAARVLVTSGRSARR